MARVPIPTSRSLQKIPLLVLAVLGIGACASSPGPDSSEGTDHIEPTMILQVLDDYSFELAESAPIAPEVRADYGRAIALLQQGALDAGIALLEQVAERAPRLVTPQIDLAAAYCRTGALEAARTRLEHALVLAPEHPAAWNELGLVQRASGEFKAARESYETALAAHPAYHYALRNLGVLCELYLNDQACAYQHYQRYLRAAPNDLDAKHWLAGMEPLAQSEEEAQP